MQTSKEWYESDMDCDIVSPGGWEDIGGEKEQRAYWHKIQITYHEYKRRRDASEVTEFGEHESVYDEPDDDDGECVLF